MEGGSAAPPPAAKPAPSAPAPSAPAPCGNRIVDNISRVALIPQAEKTCKATAMAQSLNIIVGSNQYSTSGMGGRNARSIEGQTYRGTDGKTYRASYKLDAYVGSRSEQQAQIDYAMDRGLPVIVTVHKPGGTPHHWVTIIGRNGSTYDLIDPWHGRRITMSGAGYSFGLTNYPNGVHFGYISFRQV